MVVKEECKFLHVFGRRHFSSLNAGEWFYSGHIHVEVKEMADRALFNILED